KSYAAPHRSGQAIAACPKNCELSEYVEKRDQRNAAESLYAFEFKADQKISQVNWNDDRKREQESNQQFSAAPGVFECIIINARVRPQVTADVGGEPKSIKAGRDEFEKADAGNQPPN